MSTGTTEKQETFKGYWAKAQRNFKNAPSEIRVCRVINHGSKNGVRAVKIQERYIRGYGGTSSAAVYGFKEPVWVKADQVISTWD